jgi:hypothetical protein
MFERMKERLWGKPAVPPPPTPEPVKDESTTVVEMLAKAMIPLTVPRETVVIEITKSKRILTPTQFVLAHWPYKKLFNHLTEAVMFQRVVMVPYRAQKANHGYRMLKVPLQGGWLFNMGTSTYPETPTEPAEMFAYIEDPEWELIDNVTHQLTPKGSLLVKRVCLATMSSVLDYHFVNGRVFLRLKPPVDFDLYNTLSEAAISILGNK